MNAITEQAIEVMEEFRTNMRAAGQATPAVEKFIDEMNALIVISGSPKTAMDALFHALAAKRTEQTGVRA